MTTVLVTGASKGIGLAPRASLRSGWPSRIIAGMRNLALAPELGEIAARENLDVSVETLDANDDVPVNCTNERIERNIGAIDILVDFTLTV